MIPAAGVVVLVAVIVYVPAPKHWFTAEAVTVGIGSLAIVIGNTRVQLLASIMCANQLVLVVGFKLATKLAPYAPGVVLEVTNEYRKLGVPPATVTVTLAVGVLQLAFTGVYVADNPAEG
jgi:hypothetical protein